MPNCYQCLVAFQIFRQRLSGGQFVDLDWQSKSKSVSMLAIQVAENVSYFFADAVALVKEAELRY